MDIYQIWITHNRPWTRFEVLCFIILFLISAVVTGLLWYHHKICASQAIAALLLVVFLTVVYASTVFTRTPGTRQYQLELFWSWKEILGIPPTGRMGSAGSAVELLQENILNMILLFPAGVLLSFITKHKIHWYQAALVGALISIGIEVSQLLLCRGLFEWDDIIHNTIGCVVGSQVGCWVSKKGRKSV